MKNKLTLYEYDEFLIERWKIKNSNRKNKDFVFKNSNDNFTKYLEKLELDGKKFLTLNGNYSIKTSNFIGMVKFKGMQIEVLPKLLKQENYNNDTILKNLIYMLSYTKKLNIKTSNAILSKSPNVFLEILIKEYSKSLLDALNREMPRHYNAIEGNCNFLKGKLLFNENIKHNLTNLARLYCQYDEFSANIPLNHLFYYVSYMLLKLTNDNNNRKNLTTILNYYLDIDFKKVNRSSIKNLKLRPHEKIFRTSFVIAKMFLENSSIDFNANKIENIALIFDMSKVFEEFIYEFIKKECKIKVVGQKGAMLLEKDNHKYVNIAVDLFLPEHKTIIDTKYKQLNEIPKDVPNSDIYQIISYGKRFNYNNLILLYSDNKDRDIMSFNMVKNENTKIKIAFANLGIDLKKEKEKLKVQLMKIIENK